MSAYPAFSAIIADQSGGVLRLTLNRPETRNAMSLAMVGELRQALALAEQSGTVRVVVIAGAGAHFCSGGDIRDMAAARGQTSENGQDAIALVSAAFGELCAAYAATDLAVICVVEGVAMGGGFGLACVSDITLAGQSARFGLPETRLGLVPAQIAPVLVERLGYSNAKLLAVLGGNIPAGTALRLGLVHEVADDLDAALASAINSVLSCAPGAVAATKRLLRETRRLDGAAMIEHAAKVFSDAVRGVDGAEGTAAFLGKRKPKWHPEAGQ